MRIAIIPARFENFNRFMFNQSNFGVLFVAVFTYKNYYNFLWLKSSIMF